MTIRTILVATDGSVAATKAVQYAAGLAKKLGASVIVLGVADPSQLLAPAVMTARIVMEAQEVIKQGTADHSKQLPGKSGNWASRS